VGTLLLRGMFHDAALLPLTADIGVRLQS
jgi:hypothetical protein